MGIKNLWGVLTPFCERRPLYELEGKTVAVDLSCWVCEAQNVTEYTIQPRMYLRNLYFRTCYLLLMDVNPVFILEGVAPELKYKTIAARNALQFKGAKPREEGAKPKECTKGRSRFYHTLKLCEEMLMIMGLACLQAEGEAEALCAYLSADKLVDGIISQDSDCFAYGGQIVYRNFSISQQGNHAAKGGSVDVYDLSKASAAIDFGRNKIIGLALLCGSDYSDGVVGIGKESVLKWYNNVSEAEILDKIKAWRQQPQIYEALEAKITNKDLCTACGHHGKIQSHTKKGCLSCGISLGCDSSKYKNYRLEAKNELNIRSKALQNPEFPSEALISEFMDNKTTVSRLELKWRKPELVKFVRFTEKYLTWTEVYSFEKFLPILTRWQLRHCQEIKVGTRGLVYPLKIVKKRTPKGIASFEIIWEDRDGSFGGLLPEEQVIEWGEKDKLWSTIEPQNLVLGAYPDLVQSFEATLKKPKTKAKPKKKKAVDEISELMGNVSLQEPLKKRPKIKPLELLLKAASTSTPTKKMNISFDVDFDQSNFGDEDDLDVSDIIDGIIAKGAPAFTDCSFFMGALPHENDLFETTFNQYCDSSDEP